jgi:lipopolysaccharide transport system permease protein
MAWYGYWPDWRILTLPLFVALAFVAALGPGLLITALNVRYRDFRYVIPFVLQFGLYVSPVGFSSELVGDRFGEGWRLAYSLNPMVGVIDGFRWAICPDADFDAASFLLSCAISLALLAAGIRYFRRTERGFADIL